MRKTGRKSAAERKFEVVDGGFAHARPEPPNDLTPQQAEIWRAVVRDEPIEYFSTEATRNMLKDICIARATADDITTTMNEFHRDWLKSKDGSKRFREYQKMRDIEVNRAATLSTKLRLTNQSRYTALSSATASRNSAKGIKPWEL